jgi:hypothetical protein
VPEEPDGLVEPEEPVLPDEPEPPLITSIRWIWPVLERLART